MYLHFIRSLCAVLGAATMVLASVSCGGNATTATNGQSTLEHLKQAGVVRVGYANEAPYAYADSATGRLTGEAPEIAREVFKRMGINQVEGVLTEFGSLIPGLRAKRFDVIAAGMYITPQRCTQIAFSNPTYCMPEAFIVKAGNPKNLHGYEDIEHNPDAKLGVVAGTVERGYARDLKIPDDRVVVFPDAPSALAGVQADRVDAYAGTRLTVDDLVNKSKGNGVERAEPFTEPSVNGKVMRGYGAYGFRKEDSALVDEFNRQLAQFIGTPEHEKLVSPFGFTTALLPGKATAADLCGP